VKDEGVGDTLARNIYGGIVDKGWTPAELACESGLSRNEILSYMRGLSLPTGENLAKLAKALDTTPEKLLPVPAPKQS
jgi:transcriptional regulator with XRE-family HTH domain